MKKLAISALLLLAGCGNETLLGTWELAENDKNCPIEYTFGQEQQTDENNKKMLVNVVEMYTTDKKKANTYKGTYSLVDEDTDSYLLDYGDAFTVRQRLHLDDRTLRVYFESAEKMCVYKK
ncbi:hypothetical protein P6P90_08805 [Ectobacillus antri]|jgi:predicted small lipoprotein YifL|uniref:Lipoprotein n=1 Tax=Ectobacillus antri TaxID=2486280 RepID=A0ABT6H6R6_9BACI|nr:MULTISPECIES: hypothetical protein [Ectobacillus]MDG4656969.1 hypothetical protein [Ectobacillus antri]MDG5754071.1 hypothetical protein [Ectobacillus antri]UOY93081.1 hypothetical protein MUG87_02795 [Ectobacillus sp. JY-23]